MIITEMLMNLGAVITLGLGVMAIVSPSTAAAFTSLEPVGKMGTSEIRAACGGLFAALGGFSLYMQSPTVFTVAGVAWLGAAIGRCFSIALDRNTELQNFGGVVFEGVIGLLLLAGAMVMAMG